MFSLFCFLVRFCIGTNALITVILTTRNQDVGYLNFDLGIAAILAVVLSSTVTVLNTYKSMKKDSNNTMHDETTSANNLTRTSKEKFIPQCYIGTHAKSK